ncbi:MAG: hypothetical protein JNK56_01065, partial [Myxococcales bacterium]|nr:hypothetical protein [Myxococcales bacterium]
MPAAPRSATDLPGTRSHAEYRERLRGEHLPLAFVDLELLLRNADSLASRAGSKPI